jgi:citrate lyase subunit beta/citryl-CoA lyase
VILDLEDAVPPGEKPAARESLREALTEPFRCEVAVRINALDTEWATEDVLAAVAVRADAILVPKVDGPGAITTIAEALNQADALDSTAIWAMIESPAALLHLPAIAGLARGPAPLACFVVGTNDLSLATRVPLAEGRAAFVPWLMQIVAAARAYGIDVIDGTCNDYRDSKRLAAECRQGKALGLDGKSLIHPDQVAIANEIFAPSAEERAEAQKIVAAFAEPENRNAAIIGLDSRMVERLHLMQAERTMLIAAAIDAKPG